MKKKRHHSIFFSYMILFGLSVLIVMTGFGLSIGIITSNAPNGTLVRNSWPLQYTEDFKGYFDTNEAVPVITPAGIQSLEDNRLWLQILDETGTSVFDYNTKSEQPESYSLNELLKLYQHGTGRQEVVCTGTVDTASGEWTYIIGFPMNITRVTVFLNGDKFTAGRSMLLTFLIISGLLMLVSGSIFGVWIIRHMRGVTRAIGQIAEREYEPRHGRGSFQEIYDSLNEMNSSLLAAHQERARNRRMQEEWITNITHDLKTPLSPIKGYAELLSDPDHIMSDQDRIQYGVIIMRNAEYTEALVNDLKLTYQLKSNMIPLNREQAGLSRFLRENIITLLNNPEYADRSISFDSGDREIMFSFDKLMMKRAMDNLIINSLIHNAEDTAIDIVLRESAPGCPVITITDDGRGMSKEELERLFERYYRGTNTTVRVAGTGLGVAIAKQIIETYGGSISVKSEPGQGTCITIDFEDSHVV